MLIDCLLVALQTDIDGDSMDGHGFVSDIIYCTVVMGFGVCRDERGVDAI